MTHATLEKDGHSVRLYPDTYRLLKELTSREDRTLGKMLRVIVNFYRTKKYPHLGGQD